jgi:hypothetical protein
MPKTSGYRTGAVEGKQIHHLLAFTTGIRTGLLKGMSYTPEPIGSTIVLDVDIIPRKYI